MSAAFYVQDACGEKFLFTVADADYEPAFRKHAAWWIGYRTRPSAHNDKNSAGNHVRQPVRPCKIIVEL